MKKRNRTDCGVCLRHPPPISHAKWRRRTMTNRRIVGDEGACETRRVVLASAENNKIDTSITNVGLTLLRIDRPRPRSKTHDRIFRGARC